MELQDFAFGTQSLLYLAALNGLVFVWFVAGELRALRAGRKGSPATAAAKPSLATAPAQARLSPDLERLIDEVERQAAGSCRTPRQTTAAGKGRIA